jgi:subtilisin family serine protease
VLRHLAVFFFACLATLVLSLPIAPENPWSAAPAFADDDDGGGGDDDDDGGGGGGGGGGKASKAGGDSKVKGNWQKPRRIKKQAAPRTPKAQPRPVIVAMDLDDDAVAEARRRGFSVLSDETLQTIGFRIHRLRAPRNVSLTRATAILTELGATAADLNSLYRPQASEICDGPDCNEMQLVGWQGTTGAACQGSHRLGLVETHVNLEHPALRDRKIEVIDLRPKGTKRSTWGHGTAVASLIAGGGVGSAQGLLPTAELVVAVPYYRSSRGEDVASAFDVVRAIDLLITRNADVINMSLTGPANVAIERALLKAHEKNVPIVAAAGNSGARARPLFPAAYDKTVAVTAVSKSLTIYRRAVQGEHVDFAAPGVEVALVTAAGKTELRTGTSFAAPYVAAAMAVLRKQHPSLDVDSAVKKLADAARDLGDPGKDRVFGWGLIQANALCGP